MHELSICMSLLQQVDAVRRAHPGTHVTTIRVAIGPLSGIVGELLATAYEVCVVGTALEGAKLELTKLPVRIRCCECNHKAEVPVHRLLCPNCGAWRTRVESGDELLLERVELEREEICHV